MARLNGKELNKAAYGEGGFLKTQDIEGDPVNLSNPQQPLIQAAGVPIVFPVVTLDATKVTHFGSDPTITLGILAPGIASSFPVSAYNFYVTATGTFAPVPTGSFSGLSTGFGTTATYHQNTNYSVKITPVVGGTPGTLTTAATGGIEGPASNAVTIST